VDGDYSFKKYQISSVHRAWLEEASKRTSNLNRERSACAMSFREIFFPEQLDGRLYASGQITPVGLWHLNSPPPSTSCT